MIEIIADPIAERLIRAASECPERCELRLAIERHNAIHNESKFSCRYQFTGLYETKPINSYAGDAILALETALRASNHVLVGLNFYHGPLINLTSDAPAFWAEPDLERLLNAWSRNECELCLDLAMSLAREGVGFAQRVLGHMYSLGIGVPIDVNEGVQWYRRAASQGDPNACDSLSVMYYAGWPGHQADSELGAFYRREAEAYGFLY